MQNSCSNAFDSDGDNMPPIIKNILCGLGLEVDPENPVAVFQCSCKYNNGVRHHFNKKSYRLSGLDSWNCRVRSWTLPFCRNCLAGCTRQQLPQNHTGSSRLNAELNVLSSSFTGVIFAEILLSTYITSAKTN